MNSMRAIRLRKLMTQEELAAKVKTTVVSISRYESGKRKMNVEVAFKIAKALGCTIDDLLREEAPGTGTAGEETEKPA